MQDIVKINQNDNVAVALRPLNEGETLDVAGEKVTLVQDIPQGHKFALTDIAEGESVIKYGNPIGVAKTDIAKGSWIHTHNMKTGLGDLLTYTYNKETTPLAEKEARFFNGYRRKDGRVGVRNEIWIVPTVGCVNNVAQAIEKGSQRFVTENVEGVIAFTHPYGCSQMGDDQEHTRQILADLVNHPNAGGVLVLTHCAAVYAAVYERTGVCLAGYAAYVVVVGGVARTDNAFKHAVAYQRAVVHIAGETCSVAAFAVNLHARYAVDDAAVELTCEATRVAVAFQSAVEGKVAYAAFRADGAEEA